MSRRIRVNRWRSSVTHWVCRMIGHDWQDYDWFGIRGAQSFRYCDRCGRVW